MSSTGPAAPELIHARVVDDAVQPRPERRPPLKAMERPEGLQVSLLEGVIHPLRVSEQAVSQATQRPIVQADQLNERIQIAGTGPIKHAGFRYAVLFRRSGSASAMARLIPDRRHVPWTLRQVDSFVKMRRSSA
jgi:hypothetical protein